MDTSAEQGAHPKERAYHTVAVKKEEVIVGHVPFNLAPFISAFLRRTEIVDLPRLLAIK